MCQSTMDPTCEDRDHAKTAAALLDEQGYFTDDDAFGSHKVERELDDVEHLVREAGYRGGALKVHARYISGEGNVYVAYDAARLDHEDVVSVLDSM